MRSIQVLLITICLTLPACMFPLTITNLRDYQVTTAVGDPAIRPRIAIRPFKGSQEDGFYYFAVRQQMMYDAYIDLVEPSENPDMIVTVTPKVRYESSLWNFPVMFPGFIAFAPAWNGYVYHAEIDTHYEVHDAKGALIGAEDVPVTYSIRHADVDRTAFAYIGWFIVTMPIPFAAGIYDAFVFDEAIVGGVQTYVRENYGRYVYRHIVTKTAPYAR
jgi:hypothetical protein